MSKGKVSRFFEDGQAVIRLQGQISVLQKMELREKILFETHNTMYSIHSKGTDMYQDIQ